jgi:hypothetical protein
VEHLPGGGGGQQQVGRPLERERGRLDEDVARRDVHRGGPAAQHPEGQHLVTEGASARGDLGVRADGGEHTGDLVADAPRERRPLARRDVRGVGRVDAGGPHPHRDLAGPRCWYVVRLEVEDLETARPLGHPVPLHARAA